MPVLVPTGQVINEKVVVFASDDTALLALLANSPHYWWAVRRSATLKTDLQHAPSDVFETLPLPDLTQEMRELGDRLDTYRRNVMLSRPSGLTKTYNLVHDRTCTDTDIVELRAIHRAIDEATVRAYGWDDLLDQLDHGFHPVSREIRYTIGPIAQREIFDRLLELNHERYAEEVAQGLHDKRRTAPRSGAVFLTRMACFPPDDLRDTSTLQRYIHHHCSGDLLGHLARLLRVAVELLRIVSDRHALPLRRLNSNATAG